MKDIGTMKELIAEYVDMLPTGKSLSQTEVEKRASSFLVATAHITNWRHLFSDKKIEATSIEKAVYAAKLAQSEGKGVTEKKIEVEADEEYRVAREEIEKLDNDLAFLRSYYDIFMNAHVFYRQLAKGELA